jgi:co-chaperonin GroES (HSP10)
VLKPIKKNIIITLIEKELESKGGIILTSADPAQVSRGLIVGIGPDVDLVEVGQEVLPNWNKAKKVKYEQEEFYIVHEDDLVLVFEEPKSKKSKKTK